MIVETNSVSSYQGPTNVLYLLVTHFRAYYGVKFYIHSTCSTLDI